jgi:hypothetical protein
MEKKNLEPQEWLKNEINKDESWISKEKQNFINEIKKYKKEDILPEKPKKLTLWQRLKKVLAS